MFTEVTGRQEVIAVVIEITALQLVELNASGAAVDIAELPGDAVAIGGEITIGTAFDSGTSDAIDIGDAAVADRYTSTPIDAQATGRTALTLTGFKTTAPTKVQLTWTGVDAAPTEGDARVILQYVRMKRAHFSQG